MVLKVRKFEKTLAERWRCLTKSKNPDVDMSLNCLMHERNVFRQKPDFLKLSEEHPEFKKYLIHLKNGKATIKFKDANALRCLTQCLLKTYFGLRVNIPDNRLVPAVPQRLNYVLWVEDLVRLNKFGPSVRGLDVGTGPCCIFPLLACKNNETWSFIASEKDDISYKCAQENVEANGLSRRIKVISGSDKSLVQHICESDDNGFDFIMCNPPFFDKSESESGSSLNDRDAIRRSFSGTSAADTETVTEGGEIQFVTQLLQECSLVKTRIKFYTVMLGRKSSATRLVKKIKTDFINSVRSYSITEFCQGNTVRWGLAWTCCGNVKIEESLEKQSRKIKTFSFVTEPQNKPWCQILERVQKALQEELLLDVNSSHLKDNHAELVLKSTLNTWSHQRRKRRKHETLKDSEAAIKVESSQIVLDCHLSLKLECHCLSVALTPNHGEYKDGTHQLFQWLHNKFGQAL